MTTFSSDGSRTVALFIPFDFQGRRIEAVSIGPFLLDHTLRWEEGRFKSSLGLLADLSGLPETLLRQMRYPDVDRVFGAFLDMLPANIRDTIASGQIPLPPEDEDASPQPPQATQEAFEQPVQRPAFNPDDPWANMPKAGSIEDAGPTEPPADPDRPPGSGLGFGLDLG